MSKAKAITEKQVVDYLIANWDKYFANDNIKFWKREHNVVDYWRVDLVGLIHMDLKDFGLSEESHPYKAPVFIEVKYQSESRDLIYELQKAINIRERIGNPVYVGVISDNFNDKTIREFIDNNDIHMWKIDIENDDINTLKITYYEGKHELVIKGDH